MTELSDLGKRMTRGETHIEKLWEFADEQREHIPVLQSMVQELTAQMSSLATTVESTQQASAKNTGLLEGLQSTFDNHFRKMMDWGKFWSGVKDIVMKMIESKLIVILLFVLVASQIPGAIDGAINLLSEAKGIAKG